ALLGLLNSSTGCFWMKQTFFNRGGGGVGGGIAAEAWERFYEHDGTKLKKFPLPAGRPLSLARQLDTLARDLAEQMPACVLARWSQDRRADAAPLAPMLDEAHLAYRHIRGRMIALQEDLDWQCYRLYSLLDDEGCLGKL